MLYFVPKFLNSIQQMQTKKAQHCTCMSLCFYSHFTTHILFPGLFVFSRIIGKFKRKYKHKHKAQKERKKKKQSQTQTCSIISFNLAIWSSFSWFELPVFSSFSFNSAISFCNLSISLRNSFSASLYYQNKKKTKQKNKKNKKKIKNRIKQQTHTHTQFELYLRSNKP